MMGDHPVLTETLIRGVVEEWWGVRLASCEYVRLGHGSWHWLGTTSGGKRLFVTADEVAEGHRIPSVHALREALTVCLRLANSHEFVRPPIRALSGDIVAMVEGRWALSVWPYIEGRMSGDHRYATVDDRRAVIAVLRRLHDQGTPLVRDTGLRETFVLPQRDDLLVVLDQVDQPWDGGPFGDYARRLLARSAEGVRQLMDHYDRLVERVPPVGEWVITHGQPHTANIVFGQHGPVLIDWDTVKLAPRERDLWIIFAEDPTVESEYTSGENQLAIRLRSDMIRLYTAQWELNAIAAYALRLRQHHGDRVDDNIAWQVLTGYLPIETRWPELGWPRTTTPTR